MMSTVIDDNLVIFGGLNQKQKLNDMWQFNLITRTWSQINAKSSSVPLQPTSESDMITVGRKLYMFSGSSPTCHSTIYEFDYDSLTWNSLSPAVGSPVPASRSNFCMRYDNGYLIVVGGRLCKSIFSTSNETWAFHIASRTWTQFKAMGDPFLHRGYMACAISQNRMFFAGGYSYAVDSSLSDMFYADLNMTAGTITFNTAYTQIPFYQSRDSMQFVQLDDSLLLQGGWSETIIENDLLKFDLKTLAVKQVHPSSEFYSGLALQATVTVGSVIYNLFGRTATGLTSNIILYDALTQTRSVLTASADAPKPRVGSAFVANGDVIFIFGGADLSSTPAFYNDMWSYSVSQKKWKQLVTTGSVPSARWGATMSRFSNESALLLYGGGTDVETYHELYIFRVYSQVWEKVQMTSTFDSAPDFETDSSIHASSELMWNDKELIVYGGSDLNDNPMSNIYSLNLTTYTWSVFARLQSGIKAAKQVSIKIINQDQIWLFGGDIYGELNGTLLIATRGQLAVPVDVSTSLSVPSARAASRNAMFGNTIFMFGGIASSLFTNFRSTSNIVSDIWQYSVGPICSNSTLGSTSSCIPCSAGTREENGICIPCAVGSFSALPGEKQCQQCPAGFFGQQIGAQSRSFCLPCALGSFQNNTGQSSCNPCPSNMYCPVGSILPFTSGALDPITANLKTVKTQPAPYSPRTSEVSFITIITLVSTVGASVFIIMMFMLFAKCCWSNYVHLDFFFSSKHNISTGVMYKWKSACGGMFSLIAVLFFSVVVATSIAAYAVDNRLQNRALLPSLMSPATESKLFTAQVKLVGYLADCVATTSTSSTDWQPCNAGIKSIIGADQSYNSSIACKVENGQNKHRNCTVKVDLTRLHFPEGDTTSEFSILSEEQFSFATMFEYSISASTGYPNQNSRIEGKVVPTDSEGALFRGFTSPTAVSLLAVPTVYTDFYNSYNDTGFHLDFITVTVGDQVNFRSFNSKNGLQFAIRRTKSESTVTIEDNVKKTIFLFVLDLLGNLSGVFGMVSLAMKLAEKSIAYVLKRVANQSVLDSFLNRSEGTKFVERVKSIRMTAKSKEELEKELQELNATAATTPASPTPASS